MDEATAFVHEWNAIDLYLPYVGQGSYLLPCLCTEAHNRRMLGGLEEANPILSVSMLCITLAGSIYHIKSFKRASTASSYFAMRNNSLRMQHATFAANASHARAPNEPPASPFVAMHTLTRRNLVSVLALSLKCIHTMSGRQDLPFMKHHSRRGRYQSPQDSSYAPSQ